MSHLPERRIFYSIGLFLIIPMMITAAFFAWMGEISWPACLLFEAIALSILTTSSSLLWLMHRREEQSPEDD